MIDLEELRQELKNLSRQQKLFKVLKTELSKQGYWKNKKRGNPSKAGIASVKKRYGAKD